MRDAMSGKLRDKWIDFFFVRIFMGAREIRLHENGVDWLYLANLLAIRDERIGNPIIDRFYMSMKRCFDRIESTTDEIHVQMLVIREINLKSRSPLATDF